MKQYPWAAKVVGPSGTVQTQSVAQLPDDFGGKYDGGVAVIGTDGGKTSVYIHRNPGGLVIGNLASHFKKLYNSSVDGESMSSLLVTQTHGKHAYALFSPPGSPARMLRFSNSDRQWSTVNFNMLGRGSGFVTDHASSPKLWVQQGWEVSSFRDTSGGRASPTNQSYMDQWDEDVFGCQLAPPLNRLAAPQLWWFVKSGRGSGFDLKVYKAKWDGDSFDKTWRNKSSLVGTIKGLKQISDAPSVHVDRRQAGALEIFLVGMRPSRFTQAVGATYALSVDGGFILSGLLEKNPPIRCIEVSALEPKIAYHRWHWRAPVHSRPLLVLSGFNGTGFSSAHWEHLGTNYPITGQLGGYIYYTPPFHTPPPGKSIPFDWKIGLVWNGSQWGGSYLIWGGGLFANGTARIDAGFYALYSSHSGHIRTSGISWFSNPGTYEEMTIPVFAPPDGNATFTAGATDYLTGWPLTPTVQGNSQDMHGAESYSGVVWYFNFPAGTTIKIDGDPPGDTSYWTAHPGSSHFKAQAGGPYFYFWGDSQYDTSYSDVPFIKYDPLGETASSTGWAVVVMRTSSAPGCQKIYIQPTYTAYEYYYTRNDPGGEEVSRGAPWNLTPSWEPGPLLGRDGTEGIDISDLPLGKAVSIPIPDSVMAAYFLEYGGAFTYWGAGAGEAPPYGPAPGNRGYSCTITGWTLRRTNSTAW